MNGRYPSLWPLAACALAACAGPGAPDNQGTPPADRIVLENDDAALGARVTRAERQVAVSPTGAAARARTREVFTLIAEVAPPTVPGHDGAGPAGGEVETYPLHATSVELAGDTAVVSYHRRGSVYAGAVDVFDVSDPRTPVLTASARFDHMDINAVTYARGAGNGDGNLYLSASSCDPLLDPWTAVLERMSLDRHDLTLDNRRFRLPGRVGTGAAVGRGVAFATSGTGGSLLIVDVNTGERIEEIPMDAARWVDVAGRNIAVVEGGEDGGVLSIVREGSGEVQTHRFPGARAIGAKTTVEIAGHYAFVAAGAEGMHMIDIRSGAIVDGARLPTGGPVDVEHGATNDVSVDGNLVFVANGGYGVALVRASKSLRPPSSEPSELELVGTLELGASANHVAYRRGLLFVAAGSGGLKILRVDDDA